ncbi:hypothetical protein F4810DRAFT_591025 [Camillea tinctor]|nr:hypothetical protein F4810DRAFT_591025 [Camillea tinctor]
MSSDAGNYTDVDDMSDIPVITFTHHEGAIPAVQDTDKSNSDSDTPFIPRKPIKLCAVCMRPDAKPCTNCESCCYCSQACQETDGPVHKTLCDAYVEFLKEPRPEGNNYLAILFPHDGTAAEFFWLDNQEESDDSGDDSISEQGVGEPVSSNVPTRIALVTSNMRLRRRIDREVMIHCLGPINRPNESLNKLIAHYGTPDVTPKGDVVFCVREQDLRLGDVRHAIDWFLYCHWEAKENVVVGYPISVDRVQGVRVSSVGRFTQEKETNIFEPMLVPRKANVGAGDLSEMSKLFGIPVRAQKISTENKLTSGDKHNNNNNNNPTISFLMRTVSDVNDARWGLIQEEWDGDEVGDVLLVREDGEPLNPAQVEIWSFYAMTWAHKHIESMRKVKDFNEHEPFLNTATKHEMYLEFINGDLAQGAFDSDLLEHFAF